MRFLNWILMILGSKTHMYMFACIRVYIECVCVSESVTPWDSVFEITLVSQN